MHVDVCIYVLDRSSGIIFFSSTWRRLYVCLDVYVYVTVHIHVHVYVYVMHACMHAYARKHVCVTQVMLKRLEELIVKGDEARSALGVLEHMPALTKQSAEHKLYETGLMKRRELGQAAAGILDAFVGFGAQVSITLPVPMCVSVYLCVSVHVVYIYLHTYKHNLYTYISTYMHACTHTYMHAHKYVSVCLSVSVLYTYA